jgi:hypothetical protein
MAILPQALFYNCIDPVKILAKGRIKPASAHLGVYFTESESSVRRGPFKIEFTQQVWFTQFIKVQCWTRAIGDMGYAVNQDGMIVDESAFHQLKAKSKELYDASGLFKKVWKEFVYVKDTREWFSLKPVAFSSDEVKSVRFIETEDCVVGNRRVLSLKNALQTHYPDLYRYEDSK